MSTLIITAHPDTESLTHQAATRLREALGHETTTVGHLAQEGFDPRFTLNDRHLYLGHGVSAADVVAEQDRLDHISDLVLVFPIYWWSMPALLKGWFDRVFIAGWAFDFDNTGRLVPKLGRLTVHVLATAGTAAGSFERHGYTQAFAAQVETGIFDFCGMRRGETAFVHDSESTDIESVTTTMHAAVSSIAAAVSPSSAHTEQPSTPGVQQ
ncbi:NAD(P)H-dependent oxidoreductase [Nesterenkonia halotolerans]|uniref:NAD(P)H-dependent oxidoreductase n=1 Tax=Nesterenkonia halotolerans TaxID=225325 RepID=UPI003EE748E8